MNVETKNLFLKSLLVLLIFTYSSLSLSKADNSPKLDNIKAVKIIVKDIQLAQKIAISFHHAILEVNYKDGYIIADLNDQEISQLKEHHLTINVATQWNSRYKRFQTEILKKSQNNADSKSSSGIPGFECYPTVEETLDDGLQLSTDYPDLTDWIDIGNSWKKDNNQSGYDLMVLKITNKQITEDKPKLFIHSAMHAREYTPAALTLDFAKLLLEQYSTNADIQWIVDHREIHILFHMNPDGRKLAETGIYQRKNSNDNHCPSGANSGTVGVDLNRNFAFYWNYTNGGGSSGNECNQTYRGVGPESEPETQAVSNYIRSIFPDVRGPNDEDASPITTPGMHIDIHSYSQLVLWPFGHKNLPSGNDDGFVALGNKLAWFNNYNPMQSVGLYPTDGTSDDVSYGELGIAAFTFELGTSFFQQCSTYENKIKPDNLKALVYAAKATAAPYTLAFGPEISLIELNGSSSEITAPLGSPLTISITATAVKTKLSVFGRTVSKSEYSIDTPIWQNDANVINVANNDGNLSSGVEIFTDSIDTSPLSTGHHVLYVQSYDQDNNLGVPSAVFFNIAENNSPIPEFTSNCTDLTCNFDASTSSDSDGTIEEFSWDLGDTNNNSGTTISHNYSTAGDYSVILSIKDNSGSISTKSLTVSVTAPVVVIPPVVEESRSGGGALSWIFLLSLFRFMTYKKKKKE